MDMFEDWHFRITEDINPDRVRDRWRLMAVNSDTDQVIYSEWVRPHGSAEILANLLDRKAPGVLRAYRESKAVMYVHEKRIATAW